MRSTCMCCGLPLSDKTSMELGMGPVCRVKIKQGMLDEKTGNLFANRAEYSWSIVAAPFGQVIVLHDEGGYKSLTNDMEQVLEEIMPQARLHTTGTPYIIYKDSQGIYDGVHYVNGRVDYYSINEKYQQNAMRKLAEIIKKTILC